MSPTTARPVLALSVLAGVAFLLLPAGGAGRGTLAAIGIVVIAATGLRGLARMPAEARRPWAPVALGLVVYALADVTLIAWRLLAASPPPFPSVLHLLYPLAALLLAIGGLAMVPRGNARERSTVIDALIVATSLGLATWLLLLEPMPADVVGGSLGAIQLVAYPACHLVLLVAGVRLALSTPRSHHAARALSAASVLLPATAVVLGTLLLVDRYQPGTALDLLWLLGYGLAALGIAHPSAVTLPARSASPPVAAGNGRLVLLAVMLVTLPGLQLVVARDLTDVVVAVATAVLLALITTQVGLLLREVHRSRARALELEQARGEHRLEALVRHASDVLLVVDTSDRVSYATPSAEELLGRDPVGWSTEQLLEHVHPAGRDEVHRYLLEGAATHEATAGTARLQARLLDRGDQERHVDVVAADLTDDPDVRGTVLTLHDVTERVELERRLRRLAFHDALTGLCNRELFQDRLVQALRRAARDRSRVAVLICDLDDFKHVNDTHGHATGDGLLTVLADRLGTAARATDTVARLGGDEFAIVCEGIHQTRDAIEVARRVLAVTDHPVTVGGRDLSVGVSVGIAVDDGQRSAEDLLRDADIALYEAKDDGKQRWALHQQSMTVRAQRRLELASDLSRAVAAKEIEVAFQPVVELKDRRIVGVEALARWEHPERGWVAPGEFIPIAEQSGLIVALGDAVLDAALAALRGWLDERPDLVLRLGVNVSGRQMRDPGLPGRISRLLAEHRIEPSCLILELTESVMLDEADLALEVMNELRSLGVRFAVDDFGTGYSSLAYLRQLPVSIVKTDRAFVSGLGADTGADDLARAIVEMSRSLHLDVVAEGVESETQRAILADMGCTFGQGYLFAHPVAADVLAPRLTAPGAAVVTAEPDRPREEPDDALDLVSDGQPAGHLRSR